jgi:type IV fimbrial biogenesis protein FimT
LEQFDHLLGEQEGRIVLNAAQRGVTLIELMIALAIIGFLMLLGLPAFSTFLQNTQIRNAAETTLSGITLARAEALRRNATVRFQLVSSLTSACALSATSLNWVVSLADPTGACDAAPSIVQKKSARDGTANVSVATTGGTTLVFNGLGRVIGAGISRFDFANAAGGVCEHVDATNGTMRCLSILVSTGGQAKMCDPKVTDVTDPRRCA